MANRSPAFGGGPVPDVPGALTARASGEYTSAGMPEPRLSVTSSVSPPSSDAEGSGAQQTKRYSGISEQEQQARKRRRTTIAPPIRKAQRCGHCKTCLNPSMKQACLTERAKQLQQQSGPYKPAETKLPVAPDDPFTSTLSAMLADSGGIDQLQHITRLSALLEAEADLDRRLLLLRVLSLSSELCKRKALERGGLRQLEIWSLQAVEEKKVAFLVKALQTFLTLPISVDALRSCSIGKTLKSVRKNHEDQKVSKLCDLLLSKWMKLVSPGSTASSKPNRPQPESESVPDAKRPKLAEGPSSTKGGQQPAVNGSADGTATKKPVSGQMAVPTAMDDDALFEGPAAAAAPAPKAPVSRLGVVQREARKAKVLDIDAGKKARADAEQQACREATKEPPAPQSAAADAENASAAETATGLGHPAAAPALPQNTTSIGNPNLTMARIGSQLLMDPSQMTAAERAAAAAARIPDPAPKPRRIKRKSLSWQSDAQMTAIRWFRKDEGVLAVHRDATFTEADAASAAVAPEQDSRMAVGDPSAPAFAAAARMEHQSEANALRQGRGKASAEEEEAEPAGAAAHHPHPVQPIAVQPRPVQPSPLQFVTWRAPLAVNMQAGLAAGEQAELPGQGEESVDAPFEQQREQATKPIFYSRPDQVPFSPGEPLLYGMIMGNPAFNIILDLPKPADAHPAQPQATMQMQQPGQAAFQPPQQLPQQFPLQQQQQQQPYTQQSQGQYLGPQQPIGPGQQAPVPHMGQQQPAGPTPQMGGYPPMQGGGYPLQQGGPPAPGFQQQPVPMGAMPLQQHQQQQLPFQGGPGQAQPPHGFQQPPVAPAMPQIAPQPFPAPHGGRGHPRSSGVEGRRGRGRGRGFGRGLAPDHSANQHGDDPSNAPNVPFVNMYRDAQGNRLAPEQIPCKFFNSEAGCRLKGGCRFKHVIDDRWHQRPGGR
ncbi:hypothetical protein WJX74_007213 [Apatococcus lobatus]|uniref:Serine/threonine-protein phosphatase 1 regulatory subunit 10 n=1 Tax=Apatococcus lobatus TaxID=904363 RepID=A0AAW1RND2_9CHLO